MGTQVTITAYTSDEAKARAGMEAAFSEFRRLDALLSVWKKGSEVARINEAAGKGPVSVSDETGLQTAEPFFAIFADLQPDPRVVLLHGRSGKIRFNLSAEPLLKQWVRALRQLLQKRYRI